MSSVLTAGPREAGHSCTSDIHKAFKHLRHDRKKIIAAIFAQDPEKIVEIIKIKLSIIGDYNVAGK